MKIFIKRFVLITFLLSGTGLFFSFTNPPSDIKLTITSPAFNGAHVGSGMLVKGTAEMSPEGHAWVLVRREDFDPVWWPQGAIDVDLADNSWFRMVNFGQAEDVGHHFDLAVAVFDQQQHLKLKKYWENAMATQVWPPIKMPPTMTPAITRKVLKTQH